MFIGNCFSNMSKIGKLDFVKKFCISKDIIKKVKRKPIVKDEIFENIYLIRDLYVENAYKELLQLSSRHIT